MSRKQAESDQAESDQAESDQAESDQAESDQAESDQAESDQAESAKIWRGAWLADSIRAMSPTDPAPLSLQPETASPR